MKWVSHHSLRSVFPIMNASCGGNDEKPRQYSRLTYSKSRMGGKYRNTIMLSFASIRLVSADGKINRAQVLSDSHRILDRTLE